MRTITLPALFLLFSLLAQAQNKDITAIKKTRELTNKAIRAFDIVTETSYYTNDYSITTGEGRHIAGKSAYIEAYRNDTTSLYIRTADEVQVSSDGLLAFETGHWVEKEKGITHFSGRYTAQWKKIGGVWKVRSEIYVTLWVRSPKDK